MDPISQGVLGSVASQNISRRKHMAISGLLGLVGGMAPDLDILIHSETDPLLALEYHRQFTHSLVFIPLGGSLCALLLHLVSRYWQLSFLQTLLYCTAGYATHALLDSCTSYGTQLFWPFSNMRISWNVISIIDPLFTIPPAVLVIAAVRRRSSALPRIALAWIAIYLCFGLLQKERAQTAGWELAAARGHEPSRLEAKPGIGSLLVWKVIYETKDKFYVDGIRAGVNIHIYEGDSVYKLDVGRDFPWLEPISQQALDIDRFSWFSDGFVSLHPDHPDRVIDIRYAMVPNQIQPLWMIKLDPHADRSQHVMYIHETRISENALNQYANMLLGF